VRKCDDNFASHLCESRHTFRDSFPTSIASAGCYSGIVRAAKTFLLNSENPGSQQEDLARIENLIRLRMSPIAVWRTGVKLI
jgi:hypothetical protein